TINAEVFSEYFDECPIVKIDAQRFPVTLIYDTVDRGIESEKQNTENIERRFGRGYKGKNDGYNSQISSQISGEEALLIKIEAITTRFISEKRAGDILIFLSGEKMIKDCMNRLMFSSVGNYLHILPLYGRLGKEEQERVFEKAPNGKTKVIISTNIAETSVTIDGITAVIDSGLAKLNWYNPRAFTSSLIESPISKASANQRKGRAGRTQEGTCYRLYSRKDFENRLLYTPEEIFRTDLSEVILRMADLGITDFEEFDFITAPEREGLIGGIETLNLLNALEKDHSLSNTGKLMTEFPLAPRHSRIIVEAILKYPDVIYETLIAAAFLSTQSPYILPPGEETDARQAHHRFRDDNGDFISYLKLFKSYNDSTNKIKFCEKNYLDERAMAEIVNVTSQLEEIIASMKIPVHRRAQLLAGREIDDYLCCIGRGMIQFVCYREGSMRRSGGKNSSYRSLTADKIIIHPGSVMFRLDPPFIVAGEVVRTSRMYAMSVSPLSKQVLERLGSEFVAKEFIHRGDPKNKNSTTEYCNNSYLEFHREKDKKFNKTPDMLACQNSVTSVVKNSFRTDQRAESTTADSKRRTRDFTNNIKIGGEVFEIVTVKGKKTVLLPWEKLARLGESAAETVYKGLKGKVIVKNQYNLLAGEKLELILSLAPVLDVENTFSRTFPRKENFNSMENLPELLKHLDNLVRPVVWKKNSKDLGFLGLFTDGAGNYWFSASRGFHTSLNESLSSLDTLISELDEDVAIEQKHIVNSNYRRLSDYLTG
ncbi:MAG: ATP-dependent RNA helicase, partial [Treponema sp.]|nr:ATP-dependent RNA helicase [Treponema sp.]